MLSLSSRVLCGSRAGPSLPSRPSTLLSRRPPTLVGRPTSASLASLRRSSSSPSSPPPHQDPPSSPPTLRQLIQDPKPFKEDIYTIPNLLTISRIASCPLLGWCIVKGHFEPAAAILLYAGVTDWVDGFVARKYNMGTVLGTILDPMADKTLMTTLVVSLAWNGLLPLPLAVIILGRDVALSFVGFYLRFITLPKPRTLKRYLDLSEPTVEVHPTQISKYNTFLQLVLMGTTTISPLLPVDISLPLTGLQYLVGCTTIYSGLSYLWTKGAIVRLTPKPRAALSSPSARPAPSSPASPPPPSPPPPSS